MAGSKTIIFFTILCIVNAVKENPQVKTNKGIIEGVEVSSILKNEKYFSFMGIPYGEPPVGTLRFMPPQPHRGWEGVYDAKKEKKPCSQFNYPTRSIKNYGYCGEEDCLRLSIHTPKLPTENEKVSLPVIVVIITEQLRISHNSSRDYGPDFFMKENVIIVNVNHRLGSLGFLSFEDEILPGNNGLRDVILALKWLKENVHNFGGDPNKITLMGHEEGAAMAEILLHSEKAKGLFSRVILQSGTMWNSLYFTGKTRDIAIAMSKHLEEEAKTSSFLLKRLSSVEPDKIVDAELYAVHADFARSIQRGVLPFGPVIEVDHPDAIITKYPEDVPIDVDIPVMIGYASREAIEMNTRLLNRPQFLTYADRDFVLIIPVRKGYHFKINDKIYYDAVQDVKDFYFKEGYVKISKPGEYITYMGDVNTIYPIDYAVRKYTNESKSNVFYYTFDYSGELNYRKKIALEEAVSFDGTWGATIGDDLCYLFVCKKIRKNYLKVLKEEDSEEMYVIKNMVRMWSNFAKTGNPTPPGEEFTWKPATKENKECLVISEELEMKTRLHDEMVKFWDDWMEKYKAMAIDGIVKDKDLKDEL